MFVQGEGSHRPVLLFVHGGPGMPEYWLTHRYPFPVDRHFTVAWWEQRGSGLSYEPGIRPEEMTSERFVADTLEISNRLRNRFDQEEIYLMAYSWGSYIGIKQRSLLPTCTRLRGVRADRSPHESEALAFRSMLARYRELGKTRMVRGSRPRP